MVRLARERTELRVVADQVGAPTSTSVIASAVTRVLEADLNSLPQRFARAEGIVNIVASGETSWHGFASRIVNGLRARGLPLAVQSIVPLRTEEYPTKAQRPRNSRLNLTRLREVFGISTPHWDEALDAELDQLGRGELNRPGIAGGSNS
jgi:dTDP-4-dehydrorhamnose reductase